MMRTIGAALAAALVLSGAAAAQAPTAEMFARDPNAYSAALSPSGRYVAMVQRMDRDAAIVVVDWRGRQAQAVQTARRDRGLFLEWVAWKTDDRMLFGATQRIGWDGTPEDVYYDEVQRIYAMNRDGSNITQMFEGQMRRLLNPDHAPMRVVDILANDAEHVLLGTWGQDGYTLFRANVNTGRASIVNDALGWDAGRVFVDGAGAPVMRVDSLPHNSGYQYFRRSPEGDRWQVAHVVHRSTIAQNREFNPLRAGPSSGQVYVAARPEGQEFQSIYLYDTRTGELGAPIYSHGNADADRIRVDPNDNSMLAGCGQAQRWECRSADPLMQRHFDAIGVYFDGLADFELDAVSRTKDVWLIGATGPTIPPASYVYDLNAARLTLIASAHPQLTRTHLAPARTIQYAARDGTQLWGYLTAPAGAPGPMPLVVLPHGGPESRDSYAFGMIEQYLATRGYAVFQPNFRGSEGSGRSFAMAGRRQWALRMQDDVTDGVRHLIQTGVVDPQRICIVGASYGGYAALAGGAFTPDFYRCVVSIAGVGDLLQVMNEERLYEGRNSPGYAYWLAVIGDPNRDRDALIAASPARHAANFRAPVLLIHGRADYIVRVEQSETMRAALERAGKPVRYLDFEDEGHYWDNWEPENRQRLLEEIGSFLGEHLGAPAQ